MALRFWRIVRRVLAAAVLLVAATLALTPMGCYLSRAAYEEAKILSRRTAITELVADSTTDPVTRAKLQLVLQARAFAVDSLGLRAKESFTTYSRLDRDTLVLVVSAAYKDRLERKTWWFPIVGRFPYKGFFDFDDAQRTAERLRKEGFDVTVGASAAFSTLGWFNDPLVSTTLRMDSVNLVNTVLHELLHNTFFAKGQVSFNESFASFVGGRGAEHFFRARGDTVSVRRASDDWHNEILLGQFWGRLAQEIDSVFAMWPLDSTARRIEARDTVYARARQYLIDSLTPRLRGFPSDWGSRVVLNNAVLMSRRVYAQDLDKFDSVYFSKGGNLRLAIDSVVRSRSPSNNNGK